MPVAPVDRAPSGATSRPPTGAGTTTVATGHGRGPMAGSKRATDATPVFDAALLTTLMVLCSPTAWIATYSALIFPVMLALAPLASQPRRSARDPLTVMSAAAALLLSAMTHSAFWKALGIRFFRGESYVFLVLEVLPWFGLACFALLLRQRRRHEAAASALRD